MEVAARRPGSHAVDGTTTSVFELPDHAPDATHGEWPELPQGGGLGEGTIDATSPEQVANEIQRLLTVARDALADAEPSVDESSTDDALTCFQWPQWDASTDRPAWPAADERPTPAAESPGTKAPVRLVLARMSLDARRAAAFRERELTTVERLAASVSDEGDVENSDVEIWVGDRLHARGRLVALDGCFAVRVTQVLGASETQTEEPVR